MDDDPPHAPDFPRVVTLAAPNPVGASRYRLTLENCEDFCARLIDVMQPGRAGATSGASPARRGSSPPAASTPTSLYLLTRSSGTPKLSFRES